MRFRGAPQPGDPEVTETGEAEVSLFGAVALAAAVLALAAQPPVEQEPDVPKQPGTCVVYHTHVHGNGGESWQLTCSAPIPDSVMVFPRTGRTR